LIVSWQKKTNMRYNRATDENTNLFVSRWKTWLMLNAKSCFVFVFSPFISPLQWGAVRTGSWPDNDISCWWMSIVIVRYYQISITNIICLLRCPSCSSKCVLWVLPKMDWLWTRFRCLILELFLEYEFDVVFHKNVVH
jgi:hypothetical protein